MSFPAAAIVGSGSGAIINPLDILMASVNSNPYFIGIMMLLLNLGGRFLALEISKDQEKFLSHPIIRRFFLFAVLFVATRNLIIAAGLTIIVIIFLGYLFNENSELCLWNCSLPAVTPTSPLTQEEEMILKRLLERKNAVEKKPEVHHPPSAATLYSSALTQIAA